MDLTISVSLSYFGNVSFCQGQIDLSQPNHLINHLIFPRDILFSRIHHVSSVSNSVSYACLPSHHQLCLPIIVYHLEPLHRVLPPHQHHRATPHPLSSSPPSSICICAFPLRLSFHCFLDCGWLCCYILIVSVFRLWFHLFLDFLIFLMK